MKRSLLLVILALFMVSVVLFWGVTGCGPGEVATGVFDVMPGDEAVERPEEEPYVQREDADYVDEYGEEAVETTADASPEEEAVEERVVKEGDIKYISDDVEAKLEEIEEVVEDYEGYIQDSSLRKIDERVRGHLKIKIESEEFEPLYEALGEVDGLQEKESTSEDITMEYVDIQRRKEVYRAQEERYLEMLDDAENVEEMLEVEGELERIRMEIESMEGRLQYYDSITDYSYIDITVEQREAVAGGLKTPDNIWEEFAFSLVEGWQFFSAVMVGIAAAILWGIPFIVTAGVIVFLVVLYRRRNKPRQPEDTKQNIT